MASDVEQFKPQLQELSVQDRAELAYFLISTLDTAEEDADEAWEAEIARRVAEIRAGTAVGSPAAQVFAELRERFP